jgi:hypothetical protein
MALPRIGSKVKTPHGIGEVVAIDLPHAYERIRRAVVRINEPTADAAEMVGRFPDRRLAYFAEEVAVIG